MKRSILFLGAIALLVFTLAGCTQYHMKAWDRNTHEKLGEWYVYRDFWGDIRMVEDDAKVELGQATIVLEEVKEPQNRFVLRQRSEDDL